MEVQFPGRSFQRRSVLDLSLLGFYRLAAFSHHWSVQKMVFPTSKTRSIGSLGLSEAPSPSRSSQKLPFFLRTSLRSGLPPRRSRRSRHDLEPPR